MSHFLVMVIVPPGTTDVEETVGDLLRPYDENGEARGGGFWDWWQIGGRWTGTFDGYQPQLDPENIKTCDLCAGSGVRPGGIEQFGQEWFDRTGGCNGCGGKGACVKWATEWAHHPGDVCPVEKVSDEATPLAVVTPDGEWHAEAELGWFCVERERHHTPEGWKATLDGLRVVYRDHLAVVVDCHV